MYCLKYREKAERKNLKFLKTKDRRIMLLSKCERYDSKKSKFIKEQEASVSFKIHSRLSTILTTSHNSVWSKKNFIRLLTSIVSASNHKKCMSLSNQKCMTQPTIISLHPNEHSQLHYCTFVVNLDSCTRSCNILNGLSNKVCVPNKTEDLNLILLSMITVINESKILTKHVSCEYKCKFGGRKCNSNQKWKNDKCWCECKKHHICEKDYIWNPATFSCKNVNI